MRQHTLSDPLDLHRLFRAYRSHDGVGWFFRGQADVTWPLVPKAGRPEFHTGRDLGRFNVWCERAVAYRDLPDNEWERLAVAQHYGLATRLLDWTLNPLVATFFAVAELPDADAAVYCFQPESFVVTSRATVAAIDRVIGFLPRAIDERVNRQAAVFTFHPNPAEPLVNTELRPALTGPSLVQIQIAASLKGAIREMLDDYGVHLNGLFPDLDGLSRQINWHTSEQVRKAAHKASRSDSV